MRKTAMFLAACMICSAWVFADGGTHVLQVRLEDPDGWLTITDDHVMVSPDVHGGGWHPNSFLKPRVVRESTYPRSVAASYCTENADNEPSIWRRYNHYIIIGDRRVQVGKGEIGDVTAALGLEHGGECR